MLVDKKELITKKIMDFTVNKSKSEITHTNPKKHPLSAISPTEDKVSVRNKKANTLTAVKTVKLTSMESMGTKVNEMTTLSTPIQKLKGLQELLTPLIDKVCSLKENMDCNYNRLDEKYSQLEKSISTQKENTTKDFKDLKELLLRQQDEITQKVSSQIETSNSSKNAIWEENKILKWQCSLLNNRLNKIETNQPSNNIIITGVPEEPWETYSSTQQ